ncbi:hypothetical protein ABE493_10200 [Stenotrophomonas terrae]|uniref:hypothetical protein n=1 Tax=Stenotrophomonas terrae TaxID=405446 RepID=UPI00320B8F4E
MLNTILRRTFLAFICATAVAAAPIAFMLYRDWRFAYSFHVAAGVAPPPYQPGILVFGTVPQWLSLAAALLVLCGLAATLWTWLEHGTRRRRQP